MLHFLLLKYHFILAKIYHDIVIQFFKTLIFHLIIVKKSTKADFLFWQTWINLIKNILFRMCHAYIYIFILGLNINHLSYLFIEKLTWIKGSSKKYVFPIILSSAYFFLSINSRVFFSSKIRNSSHSGI